MDRDLTDIQKAFIATCKGLDSQIKELEKRKQDLKSEYIQQLPFKVNDCVKINPTSSAHRDGSHPEGIDKCWIDTIRVCTDGEIILFVNLPKKDGTRGSRRVHVYSYAGGLASRVRVLSDKDYEQV